MIFYGAFCTFKTYIIALVSFAYPQVDELRGKLEEKNKLIEKKTQAALHATQDKNRISNELSDLRDQVDIKDRKINVLQRKVKVLIYKTHCKYFSRFLLTLEKHWCYTPRQ